MATKNKQDGELEAVAPGTLDQPVRAEKPGADTHVVVEHGHLGAWPRGSVLAIKDLERIGGDIERFLGIGAVRAYDPERDADTPVTQTLAEAVRSASPPTLPVVPPSVVTTPEELAEATDPDTTKVTGALPDEPRPIPAEAEGNGRPGA